MTPVPMIVAVINRWNTDPTFTPKLRGRRLVASHKDDVLSVAWGDAEPFFVVGGNIAAQVGWSDSLTDLIEMLDKEPK